MRMKTGMDLPHPPAVDWKEDRLLLLDQRRLPTETVYLELTRPEEVREAIRELAVRGAPAIGIAAAYGLYLGVRDVPGEDEEDFWETLNRTCDRLGTSRPTAVNLYWALRRMVRRAESLRGKPLSEIKEALLREAEAIRREDAEANRTIGEHALSLLKDGMGVLTHCNAGGLATADYGTALAPFYLAAGAGDATPGVRRRDAPRAAGRPADRLGAACRRGIDVTLICDNMAAAGHAARAGCRRSSSAPTGWRPTATPPTRSAPTAWRCWPRPTASPSMWPRPPRRSI